MTTTTVPTLTTGEGTIRTTLHAYRYDLTKPEEKAAYVELVRQLKAQGLKKFHASGTYYYPEIDGRAIDLEVRHLFENQWNTTPIEGFSEKGHRVFDWAESVFFGHYGEENKSYKCGHYLEQTDAMREVRRNVNKCGYCGAQEPAAKGYVFCPHCLDSEYLKDADLYLTRMRPIDRLREPLPPLSEAERAHLLPLYKEAQLHGATERGKKRIAKARRDIETKYSTAVANAKAEHDGFLWLMDHGISTGNVIYYTHTGRFGFGWRSPYSPELVSALLDIISEFPYAYDITCQDGRTLSGG